MKARRLFDADATEGYLLDGKYWIDPLIAGVKTNADRIRAMTDEELAEYLTEKFLYSAPQKMREDKDVVKEIYGTTLDWLKQKVENDG